MSDHGQAAAEARSALMSALEAWMDAKDTLADCEGRADHLGVPPPRFCDAEIDRVNEAREAVELALDAYTDARIAVGVFSGARVYDVPADRPFPEGMKGGVGAGVVRVHPSNCPACQHPRSIHKANRCRALISVEGKRCDCVQVS